MMLLPVTSALGDAVAVVTGIRPELLGVQKLSDFSVVRANLGERVAEFRIGRRIELCDVKPVDLFEVKW